MASPTVQSQPPPPSAPADPYPFSSTDSTSVSDDLSHTPSQSTANTADTSPPQSYEHPDSLGDKNDLAYGYTQAPFRPHTPPGQQAPTNWRYSMPDPAMTSPLSALTSPDRGAKRTASGAFKFPSPGALSPAPRSSKHARHTSTDSVNSRVSELSAQLRARLSYAMIKVQNGWEHKPIHEVEHLASQSPYLSPSGRVTLRQSDSPRSQSASCHFNVAFANDASCRKDRSRGSSDAALTRASRALHEQANGAINALPNPYQSIPSLAISQLGGSTRPATAYDTAGHYTSRVSAFGPVRVRASTPTPQEQDALDSLISMSSPAHSIHYSRKYPNGTSAAASTAASSAQGSPTRAVFSLNSHGSQQSSMPPPALRPGSSRGSGASSNPSDWAANVRRDIAKTAARADGNVERLLDEMRAYSSDEAEPQG